jgi:predicted DNA-binding transcriptional regulator AlpA
MRPAQMEFNRIMMEMDRIAQMSPLGEQALLTPEHLAVILGCSVRGVAKLRRDGRLPPAVRIGVLVRWRLSVMRMWAQRKCDNYAPIETVQAANAFALRDDDLMSAEHFAIALGCSVRHLSNLRRRDRLPHAVRVGNSRRWRVGDVRLWVLAGCRP